MAESKLPAGCQPWRGVNLGGWLLLEPGPSGQLFPRHQKFSKNELRCEWSLTQVLRRRKALKALVHHRETFYTKQDFEQIRQAGLNAIRIPFGYWVVLGPTGSDPYVGPAIEYVDRAVTWAGEVGLQVMLDLHGAPGGESGDAPSGHHIQEGEAPWHWRNWRFDESLRALKVLAERYRNYNVVTGIAVCNEPSPTVPAKTLCHYYDLAVGTIRGAGMHESQVAIALPCFQRDLTDFVRTWDAISQRRHKNVCFDLHPYFCFGNRANGRTLEHQLWLLHHRAREFLQFPTVIGEWSLALGHTAKRVELSKSKLCTLFADAQRDAYRHASHGSFFWCWKDRHSIEWSYKSSYKAGFFSQPSSLKLHVWDCAEQDSLEETLEPTPWDPELCYGDLVYLRGFHGRLLHVNGCEVEAAFGNRGPWQQFVVCPPKPRKTVGTKSSHGRQVAAARQWGTFIREGDVVRLLAHNGYFVSVVRGRKDTVIASLAGRNVEFMVQRAYTGPRDGRRGTLSQSRGALQHHRHVQHLDEIYLRSHATSRVLHADGSSNKVGAIWKHNAAKHRQTWQELASERAKTSKHSWRVFTVERSKRRMFSSDQMKVMVPEIFAAMTHENVAATSFPCSKRKRSWCSLLMKSANKRQRVQLSTCLPLARNSS